MKRYIAPLLIALLAVNATAQTSMSLYHMEVVTQSSMLNPARAPRCNGHAKRKHIAPRRDEHKTVANVPKGGWSMEVPYRK